MAATKNLCAQLPLDLHQRVCEAREQSGLTTAQYITNLLIEYYEMKKNGGNTTMATNNGKRATPYPPEHPPRGRTGTSTCSSAAGPEKGGISAKPIPDNTIIQAQNQR